MKLSTNKKLCTLLGFINLACYSITRNPLNLYISMIMCAWVVFLELIQIHKKN
ncbi:uncharacterized protein METZ01_LOCUS130346 [marine metagenome]|uniref:Uncharacterized protein n=1 Tax=marine metagenome TaxID=408172 RepID=A0A381YLM6_9ZZZZ